MGFLGGLLLPAGAAFVAGSCEEGGWEVPFELLLSFYATADVILVGLAEFVGEVAFLDTVVLL